MDNIQLTQVPVMKTGMLIRTSVAEVFEAFVDSDQHLWEIVWNPQWVAEPRDESHDLSIPSH